MKAGCNKEAWFSMGLVPAAFGYVFLSIRGQFTSQSNRFAVVHGIIKSVVFFYSVALPNGNRFSVFFCASSGLPFPFRAALEVRLSAYRATVTGSR